MIQKVPGFYVKNYFLYHALRLKTKIGSVLLLWLILGSTILFAIDSLRIRILLILIGCGVTIHLITIKTLAEEQISKKLSPHN
ncbi:MAG: hypothetical protein JXQ65_01850 [Candidatus Marinimicrobia bacterium]|nr:hypothetical protein [Candidatus Neomarinimicrobiota bacterium]